MGRVEAAIFAARDPVPREALAALVGTNCNLDALIDDIAAELRLRPNALVFVAGGWQMRTRPHYAAAIRGTDEGDARARARRAFRLCDDTETSRGIRPRSLREFPDLERLEDEGLPQSATADAELVSAPIDCAPRRVLQWRFGAPTRGIRATLARPN